MTDPIAPITLRTVGGPPSVDELITSFTRPLVPSEAGNATSTADMATNAQEAIQDGRPESWLWLAGKYVVNNLLIEALWRTPKWGAQEAIKGLIAARTAYQESYKKHFGEDKAIPPLSQAAINLLATLSGVAWMLGQILRRSTALGASTLPIAGAIVGGCFGTILMPGLGTIGGAAMGVAAGMIAGSVANALICIVAQSLCCCSPLFTKEEDTKMRQEFTSYVKSSFFYITSIYHAAYRVVDLGSKIHGAKTLSLT